MQRKKFVLDTNVWITNSDCYKEFDGDVYVPFTVLEEIDYLKGSKDPNVRFKSRQATRKILSLFDKKQIIPFNDDNLIRSMHFDRSIIRDLKIINVASILNVANDPCTLVSQDNNVLIRAKLQNIPTLAYRPQDNREEKFTGWVDVDHASDLLKNDNENIFGVEPDGSIFRKSAKNCTGIDEDMTVSGIDPLNMEQAMAMNLLLDNSLDIVTIEGRAGSGKTLLATACAFRCSKGKKAKYAKVFLTKPVIEIQAQIGYLPGNVQDKLEPHFRPFKDAIELASFYDRQRKNRIFPDCSNVDDLVNGLIERNKLSFECISYMRGRSIPRAYLIVDEAQNLTKHEIFTIISRAGFDTKIVLLGDSNQIDNHRLTKHNNGFSVVQQKFRGMAGYGHISLSVSERSKLAEMACNLLA